MTSTTNIDKLRKRLAEMENKKQGNSLQWKPEEGKTVIRIVPRKDDPTDPFITLYFHYNVGKKTLLSPISYGEPDPIAEFSDSLIAEGNNQLSKEEYKEAKRFSPTPRYFVPVVVRGQEKEGVKYWGFGVKTYKDLISIFADEDYGDIADVKSGHDITVTFTPKEKSDTKFAVTEIMPKPKSSPLATDAETLKKFLNEQADLLESYERHSYADLQQVLGDHLEPKDQEDVKEVVAETAAEETTAPQEISPDVADEFDAIFNNS